VTRPDLTARLLAAVALGGAVGALTRWGLTELVPDDGGFPWTTFAINVAGSFLLAMLPALAWVRHRPLVAVGLGPGLLGGFTTLSAYAEQGRVLFADGHPVEAWSYLAGTLIVCVVAVQIAVTLSTAQARAEFEEEDGDE
jgi:fluoride exporter